jgi:O-antigen ligase
MKTFKQVITYLIYFFIILLPLQTRLIYKSATIKSEHFEYGSLSLYGTEILLGLIMILSIIYFSISVDWSKIKEKQKNSYKRLGILAVFLAFFVINILLAANQEVAWQKFSWLINAIAFVGVLLLVRPKVINLGIAFTISALAQSYFAINQFMEQKVIANKWLGMAAQDPEVLGAPVIETADGRWLRTFGSLTGPNVLAPFLVIALFLIIYLYPKARTKRENRFFLLSFVIIAIAALTTLSKAAILALIFFSIIYGFFVRKDKLKTEKTTKLSLILLFVIIIFTVSYPSLVVTRITGESRLEQHSYEERLDQYSELQQVIKNNWLWGAGLGNYAIELQKVKPNQEAWTYQPVHNAWLVMLAEIGLIGTLLLIGSLVWAYTNKIKTNSINLILLTSLSFMALFYHFWWSLWFGLIFIAFIVGFSILNHFENKRS